MHLTNHTRPLISPGRSAFVATNAMSISVLNHRLYGQCLQHSSYVGL